MKNHPCYCCYCYCYKNNNTNEVKLLEFYPDPFPASSCFSSEIVFLGRNQPQFEADAQFISHCCRNVKITRMKILTFKTFLSRLSFQASNPFSASFPSQGSSFSSESGFLPLGPKARTEHLGTLFYTFCGFQKALSNLFKLQ